MDSRGIKQALEGSGGVAHAASKFTAAEVDFLSRNLFNRYLDPSKNVGHAVIMKDKEGKKLALQFPIPQGSEQTPQFLPLKDIEEINRFGLTRYTALTLDDIRMDATRYIHGDLDGQSFQIACFSPRKNNKEPFWGDDLTPILFQPNNDGDTCAKIEVDIDEVDVQQQAQQLRVPAKGGNELALDAASIRMREQQQRVPGQDIMGESAKDAYDNFYDHWERELSDDMKKIFRRAIYAPLNKVFQEQYRPEWVHATPFILSPLTQSPDYRKNIGAAGRWANVEMMVLTHIVKWFALNCPSAIEKIKPRFEMLLNSELIEKINYNVSIEEQGHIVTLFREINPFAKWPLFRKPTDVTQGVAVVHAMLNGTPPISILSIFAEVKKREREEDVKEKEVKQPRFE